MPTGYTDAIAKGITFREFALHCARAFGACVTLRDEGGGGEAVPDEIRPSPYYLTALTEARKRLDTLIAMTPEQAEQALNAEWERKEADRLAALDRSRKARRAYETMLAQVGDWAPPTPDHDGLKGFMREQIEESIRFDCAKEDCALQEEKPAVADWISLSIREAEQEARRCVQRHEEEIARAASSTAWIRALKAALPASPKPVNPTY